MDPILGYGKIYVKKKNQPQALGMCHLNLVCLFLVRNSFRKGRTSWWLNHFPRDRGEHKKICAPPSVFD